MKVILEAQHAVGHAQPRGVGHYSINLMQALLRREKFEYEIAYFDYGREAGNYERAERYFGEFNIPMHECNELDYRVASRDESVFANKSYNEYTGTNGDIYHFTNFLTIPTKLCGKMLATVHDLNWIGYEEGTSPTLRPLLKISFDRMNRIKPNVVAVSQSAKKEILEYASIPEENIHVVYQSYNEEELFPDRGTVPFLEEGCEYLFFVGTFERKKNIVRIVKAFDQIAAKFNGLRLVLAGKPTWDDPAAIYQAIEDSPFRDRIITPGYVNADAKRLLYSNALGLVFPSICEGFGIPVLEAMACGCPVITANNTSLPEVGGDAAVYVDAGSTEQLAFEMERVINSETLRKEMIQKGFAQKDKFSWEKTAELTEKVYGCKCY